MGPYPHDSGPAAVTAANPMGTDGFEFVEYASTEPEALGRLFETMGFSPVARHRSKNVTLYRQGDINFVVNAEPDSFARRFADAHGPCACAMAFRVADAAHAQQRAIALGAKPAETRIGPMELNIPAIEGIGGSQLYFVDRYGAKGSIWDVDFVWTGARDPKPAGQGLFYIDHLTHNVRRGQMRAWSGFYGGVFNFREQKYFDIKGKATGLFSQAMIAPDRAIRIPLNESQDENSQIEEFLRRYNGEGIQHIALATDDIFETVEELRRRGIAFQDTIETYFELIDRRLPNHGEDVERMRKNRILIDGSDQDGILLQIFTQDTFGPIFFEIIQRKGNQAFGEGNFQALFDSIELDQIRRGVIKVEA